MKVKLGNFTIGKKVAFKKKMDNIISYREMQICTISQFFYAKYINKLKKTAGHQFPVAYINVSILFQYEEKKHFFPLLLFI